MSRAISICPGRSLVDEVRTHLIPSGNDYSRNTVVFPGKRPAHVLRKRIAEQTGGGFIPPRIYSIDTFVDAVYAALEGSAKADLGRLDAVVILRELYRRLEGRPGGDAFTDIDLFLPFGFRLFADLEEIAMSSVPPTAVDRAFAGVSLRSLHSVGILYRQFYEEVRRRGLTTRAMRYAEAGERINAEVLGNPVRIIVAGFFALTGAERAMFHRLMGMEQTVAIFQEGRGLAEQLQVLHLSPERMEYAEREGSIRIYAAPDTHGEVLGLGRCLQDVPETAQPDENTVIVVPNPDALPALLHQTLAALPDDAYNISLGYPHTRTPVFGFLTALMDLVGSMSEGRFLAADYVKFVLHPYTKNILHSGRAHVTRVMFHAIEDLIRDGEIPAFFALEDLEARLALFERTAAADPESNPEEICQHLATIHTHTIRTVVGARDVGDLASRCIDVLSYIAGHSTAQYHPLFTPYLESMLGSLRAVEESLIASSTSDDPATLFRTLKACISDGTVPFPGTPFGGLQVLGFLETRNLRFDRVFFLDVNEGVIPSESARYSLIPNQARTALGLPTHSERERVAAYYFDLLIKGAQETRLFFIENDQNLPSRFVEEIIWDQQREGVSPGREHAVTKIRYKTLLSHSLPAPMEKSREMTDMIRQMSFSTKRLDTYLRCGLKFYYAYVLRLEEREDVSDEVDRAGLGRIVHEILREYYLPYLGQTLSADVLDPVMIGNVVDRSFQRQFGDTLTENRFLLRMQVKRQLISFLREYEIPRLKRSPVTLTSLEEQYDIVRDGFRLGGRIDRVEQRGTDIAILDYKTAGNASKYRVKFNRLDPENRSTWNEAIGSLQLGVYHLLYASQHPEHAGAIVPAYLMLGAGRISGDIEVPLFEEDRPAGDDARMLAGIVDVLLRELTDETIPLTMTDTPQEDCPDCAFRTMCGTQWTKRRWRGS